MAADLFASRMSDAFTNLSLLDEDSGRFKAGTRPVDIPSAAEQNAHLCMCTVSINCCGRHHPSCLNNFPHHHAPSSREQVFEHP